MSHDVFISHSSRDKPAADALCAALERSGVRCWIAPRDVLPGRAYSGEIIRGIKTCRVLVLVFSADSNASPDVLREVQLATRHRLHLINFRIEAAAVSDDLDYFLGIPHWLDAITEPMAEHHARLVESVKSLLALDPPPPPPRSSAHGIDSDPEAEADLPAEEREPLSPPPRRPAPASVPPPSAESSAPSAPASRPAREPRPAPAPKPIPDPLDAPGRSRPDQGLKWLVLTAVLAAALVGVLFWPRDQGTAAGGNSAASTSPGSASQPPLTVPSPSASVSPSAPSAPPAAKPAPATPPAAPVPAPAPPSPSPGPVPVVKLPPVQDPIDVPEAYRAAAPDRPLQNSLGMSFVCVPITLGPTDGKLVLFSIYETRVKDMTAFSAVKKEEAGDGWQDMQYDKVAQTPDHPVVNVRWVEATAFCRWLTEVEHAKGTLPRGLCYRLPTDHEWSCAAGLKEDPAKIVEGVDLPDLGDQPPPYVWGTAWPPPPRSGNYADQAAHKRLGMFAENLVISGGYDDGFPFTAPVGSYSPNAFGLYDLGGNAWEWCQDGFLDNQYRVCRGAGWTDSSAKDCRADKRSSAPPTWRNYDHGFRVVIAAPLPE